MVLLLHYQYSVLRDLNVKFSLHQKELDISRIPLTAKCSKCAEDIPKGELLSEELFVLHTHHHTELFRNTPELQWMKAACLIRDGC